MDFLDPKKSRAHQIRLIVGYVMIAIALGLATLVLKYHADGYGLKQGEVVQNGLVFFSSTPGSADIYINDQRRDSTNTRMNLQSGTYSVRIGKEGYHDWRRGLTVEGGSVEHIDYPFLVPNNLAPKEVGTYASLPTLATQSPDRRWVLVQQPGSVRDFDVYDVKDPKKAGSVKTSLTVPETAITAFDGAQTLEAVEWSNDNDHVLLQHDYDGKTEFLIVSRKTPEESVNLTQKLPLAVGDVPSLQDKKYDKYFIHNTTTQVLQTATLTDVPTKLLDNVIDYKTYGSDVVEFVTKQNAADGKVNVVIYQDKQQYVIRSLNEAPHYVLELSRYSDSWFVTAGSTTENRVYVYKDPVADLRDDKDSLPTPVDVLKINSPTYVAISASSQFILAQNGNDFAAYDVENDRTHVYHIDAPMDAPQQHATWMDGSRIMMVSGARATFFDYDGTNVQTLVAASPERGFFFDTSYAQLYSLAPSTSLKPASAATSIPQGQYSLTATWMRTENDR